MPVWLDILVAAIAVVSGVGGGIAWLISRSDIAKSRQEAIDAAAEVRRMHADIMAVETRKADALELGNRLHENKYKVAFEATGILRPAGELTRLFLQITNKSNNIGITIAEIGVRADGVVQQLPLGILGTKTYIGVHGTLSGDVHVPQIADAALANAGKPGAELVVRIDTQREYAVVKDVGSGDCARLFDCALKLVAHHESNRARHSKGLPPNTFVWP